jgi:3-hydroxybutyryl-CoA dehydratase
MVAEFAHAVDDFNPIHFDEEYASKTRFKRPIAHGALLGGLVSGMLVETFGEGTIYVSTNLNFLNPVYVGDMVEIELTDLGRVKGRFNVIAVQIKDTDEQHVAVQGSAEIIPGKKAT